MRSTKITLVILISFSLSQSFAQSTWAYVYSLLQNNGCASSCHDGTGGSTLDLYENGDMAAVYDNLINVAPTNPTAVSKHNKLVFPGVPEMSFLLRKINSGFDENLAIEAAEGDNMPVNASAMTNREIEIIRQWILYGAKETGNKVDTAIISNYYNTYGNSAYFAGKRIDKPSAPNATEGFQLHFGPVFLNPNTEEEINIKIPVFLDQDVDVTEIDEYQNYNSHHFLLYQFESPSSANGVSYGLRSVDDLSDISYGTLVSAWAYSRAVVLPTGTSYKWEDTTYFDFNYHIPNQTTDSIMAAEIYINIYATPQSSSRLQMYSTLINYGLGGLNPYVLNLPNLNQYDTLWDATYDLNATDSLFIWMLSSHTHKYGKDYDIYKRNSDGTRGDQLYEGYFNEDYSFNQGYYDWEHPAVRYFDKLEPVAVSDGLIHEAVFYNYGTQSVGYGLTTDDEMMLFFMQYTASPIDTSGSGITTNNPTSLSYNLNVWPTPSNENSYLSFAIQNDAWVKVEISDVLGRNSKTIINQWHNTGQYQYGISADLADGMYLIRLTVGNESVAKKITYVNNK